MADGVVLSSCSLPKVIVEVSKLKASPLVIAAGPAILGEIEGVVSLITNLSMAVPPKQHDIEAFSDYFKMVLKRLEFFCYAEVVDSNQEGGLHIFQPRRRCTRSGARRPSGSCS